MIEIRNLHLPLTGGKAFGEPYKPRLLRMAVARKLGVGVGDIKACEVAKRSIDARKERDVHYVATVRAVLWDGAAAEAAAVAAAGSRDVSIYEERPYELPKLERALGVRRPVVVGAGAAGLFAALALAEAGAQPVLVERGAAPAERTRDVAAFNETGLLDPQSNIQFGAGGAGTFSDGKLTTGTSSPAHSWIVQTFVEAGARPDIAWQGAPHIGSDVLPGVVENLVARIEAAGGEVRWHTRMTELVAQGGRLVAVRLAGPDGCEEELACDRAVLACGHSARDVFEMLKSRGYTLEPKTFSMGARIEHPQHVIDRAQYGAIAGSPALPPASYRLNCHLKDGRGVYTFCMCPGGTVVAAASEPGGVVTNGMSVFLRDGANANAALLANVNPEDIPGIEKDVLAGVALQRQVERAAFEAGGGAYRAPAQLLGDFVAKRPSRGCGSVKPSYPRGVTWGDVGQVLPDYVARAIRAAVPVLARRLDGFDRRDAVLTGVETRTSSPVRVLRDGSCRSVDVAGVYPAGEGAGYAGGIMSAAADGLRCAAALVADLNEG
jgi:hypothetical protein